MRSRTENELQLYHFLNDYSDRYKEGCYIYVLRAGDVFKIGRTERSPYNRALSFWVESGRSADFDIINWIPVTHSSGRHYMGLKSAEKCILTTFKERRLILAGKKELFLLDSGDIKYIKSIREYQTDKFVFR